MEGKRCIGRGVVCGLNEDGAETSSAEGRRGVVFGPELELEVAGRGG